jgi:diguanylate cyclase (GGDEF)-like protein
MNISPSALLAIVVATTIANILILVMVSLRSKNNRARRLAAVETMLATSYFDDQGGDPEPEAQAIGDGSDGIERAGGAAYEEAWVKMEREAHAVEGSAGGIESADQSDGSNEAIDADQAVRADQPVGTDDPVVTGDPVATEEPLGEAAGTASMIGRDPLTGLLDALSFREVLAHEDAREQRYGRPATVVVFELDGLSKIVDRLGPNTGDRIEVALADTIARLARRADYVARLEPARYGVLLPETDEVAAINYVERIRRACDLWLESGAIAMRLAIGWASTGGDIQLAAAIRTATDRMRLESRRNARLVDEDTAKDVAATEAVAAGESDHGANGL